MGDLGSGGGGGGGGRGMGGRVKLDNIIRKY